MLAISIRNPQQTDQFQHESGSLTLGREPSSHPAHLVINDDYVSRRHLIVEPISENRVRLDNVGRNPLQISDGHVVPPGQSGEFDLPVQLRIGSTVIDLAVVRPPAPAEV